MIANKTFNKNLLAFEQSTTKTPFEDLLIPVNHLTVENDLLASVVQPVLQLAQEKLQEFAKTSEFSNKMAIAFGEGVAAGLQNAWENGVFSLPKLEIISATEINGANGAFAGATNTIYLAQEFLRANVHNLDAILDVFLEEYGHFVDYSMNDTDSPGDEGAIFSALVQQQDLSASKLSQLKLEDDKSLVILNGKFVEIEKDGSSTTFTSGNPILEDYDQDGDLDILFNGTALTPELKVIGFFGVYRNLGNGFSTPIINNTTIGWNPSFVEWSDYDKDGDLDLVANGDDGANNAIIRLYTNTSNGNYSSTPYAELSISSPAGSSFSSGNPILEDYDQDGDLDILFNGTALTPELKVIGFFGVYRNLGNGFSTPIINNTTIGWNPSFVEWSDYDKDGDLDLVANGDDGANHAIIRLYTNTSNGNYSSTPYAELSISSPAGSSFSSGNPILEDYDQDGDLDILFNGTALTPELKVIGFFGVYRNLGNGFSTPIINNTTIGWNPSFVEWSDYDKDGDLDLVANGDDGANHAIIRLYTNTSNGNYSSTPYAELSISSPAGSSFSSGNPILEDYDQDGDLDILFNGTALTPELKVIGFFGVYRNLGNGFSTPIINNTTIGWNPSFVEWSDYDKDGDLDLVANGDDGANHAIIRLYTNTSNGNYSSTPYAELSISSPAGSSFSSGNPILEDYDQDGDLDILFNGTALTPELKVIGFFGVYRNLGNGFSTPIINNTTIGWNPSFVEWSDYDKDGDLDLVANGDDGANNAIIRLYTNTGNGNYSSTPYAELSISSPAGSSFSSGNPILEDYDQDGDLDILFNGTALTPELKVIGFFGVYRNLGNGFSTPIINNTTIGWNPSFVEWSDYDKDGDLDLVANGDDGANHAIIRLYTNTSNGNYSSTPYAELSIATPEILSNNCILSINDAVVIEGELATFTVTVEGDNPQPITVYYSTSSNTASIGADYEFTNGTLTFNSGEKTKTITVKTLTDSLSEADETFFVNLTTSNTGVTITDDQGLATIQDVSSASSSGILSFSNPEFRINENGQAIVGVTVTRTGGSNGSVSATITLSNGTAIAPNDYNNSPITVNFAAGDTNSKVIQIPIIDDSIAETNETINLTLTNPTGGATLGSQKIANLVIVDNDVTLTSPTPEIYEYLAKDIAYKTWSVGATLNSLGLDYSVDAVFEDPNGNGFYGLGLISPTLKPILALRGTEPTANFLADIFADLEPEGVGFQQFQSHQTQVEEWLNKHPSSDIVGHSLGGALTQFFAADFTNKGGVIGNVYTFNSPGISQEWANKFNPSKAAKVKHHIVSGDLVSLAGDDYISGEYELFRYSGFIDYVKSATLNKHLNPILAAEVNYDSLKAETKLLKPTNVTSQKFSSVDSLNNEYFTYLDPEFFSFLIGAFLLTSSSPDTQLLVSSLLFRSTVEQTRQDIGKKVLPIIDELGITDNQNTGGSVKLPDVNFKLLNLLEVKSNNLGATFVEQPDRFLKLQGQVTLPDIFNATADFTNNNFVKISYAKDRDNKEQLKVDVVGSIFVENIPIVPNIWEVKRASLSLDSIQNEIKGSGLLLIPTGIEIGGGMGFINGQFNYLSLQADQLNKPIGATGAFLQHISGEINNVAPSDPDPIEFTGGLGFTAGPKIDISVPSWFAGGANFSGSLFDIDLIGSLNQEQIQGNGNIKLLGGLATGQGNATLNWNSRFLDANLNLSIGDIINAQSKLKADANFNFGLVTDANIKAPTIDFEVDTVVLGKKKINLGGQELTSAQAVVEFTNDNNLANDFIRSSGQIDIPIIGKQDAAFTVYLNGRAQIKIGNFLKEINSFRVDPGTKWVIFNANWDTPSDNVKVKLKKPDGSILQESDFANSSDISVVSNLSSSKTRAVVVANPEAGIWDINVVDATGLGDVQASAFRDSEAPSIQVTNITANADASEIVINYAATDPDSEAQISLFYDTDASGYDGILMASGIKEADGTGTFKWNTQGVAPGTYHIYAMSFDENHAPVFTYAPNPVQITAQADLAVTKIASADRVNIADRLTYTITITNNGSIESQGITLSETLAKGSKFVSANLTPVNQSEDTLTFDLGNLATSATKTVEITVTAPSTTGIISSRSQINSKTFDPNANNDFVILDTAVVDEAVANGIAKFNENQVFSLGGKAGQTKQLRLSFNSQNTNFVNEIGFFTVDDDRGTIEGVTPDNSNYLATALKSSQVIFSALPNNVLKGVDFTRQFNLDSSDRLVFYLVQNSTTDTILADLAAGRTPANILFAIPSANQNGFAPLQVSNLENEAFTLAWKDTLNSSDTAFNDLILNVEVANEKPTAIGTGLQGKIELIDLRNLGTLDASFKVASEAAYNNTIGWYVVDDESGSIGNLRPGDVGYAQAAIAQRSLVNLNRNGKDSAKLEGLLAPYIIADSSIEKFLAENPHNTADKGAMAYFAFMAANPDGVDHIRQLGDNTFGFEDLFAGGDSDYNDIILQVNFA
ncbi:FG-GAP-like repeat-containing protein [Calothrix sp. NIES-2098]|uniref:FG-GAP-like repeat-containing protein n=1 Tax=Calothrix sp. NIES-2098 TaxID=1954171 RepID=UPI000B60A30E|nr:hypothetical protein NIES2098_01380 [Calothrix sp. NIES-2098]